MVLSYTCTVWRFLKGECLSIFSTIDCFWAGAVEIYDKLVSFEEHGSRLIYSLDENASSAGQEAGSCQHDHWSLMLGHAASVTGCLDTWKQVQSILSKLGIKEGHLHQRSKRQSCLSRSTFLFRTIAFLGYLMVTFYNSSYHFFTLKRIS